MSKRVELTEDPEYQEFEDQAALEDIESLFGGSSGTNGQSEDSTSELAEFAKGKTDTRKEKKEEPAREVEEDSHEDDYDEYEAESEESDEGLESEEETEGTEESSELQELRAEIVKLRQLVEERGQEEVLSQERESFVVEDKDFLADIEEDDLFANKEAIGRVSNDIYKAAVAMSRELILRELPSKVTPLIRVENQQFQQATQFYNTNPDIASLDREYVKGVAKKLASKFPDWSGEKLMTELPKIIRKELKLKTPEGKPAPKKRPGVRPTGTRRVAPPSNEMEKEIDALLNLDI